MLPIPVLKTGFDFKTKTGFQNWSKPGFGGKEIGVFGAKLAILTNSSKDSLILQKAKLKIVYLNYDVFVKN